MADRAINSLVKDVLNAVNYCDCGSEGCLPEPADTRQWIIALLTKLNLIKPNKRRSHYVLFDLEDSDSESEPESDEAN